MDSRDQFFDKLGAEYDGFIGDLRTRNADEIINSSYRKVCYDEIVAAFEGADYSEQDYGALTAQDGLLSSIYSTWLDTDTADFEQLPNIIEGFAARELGYTLAYAADEAEETPDVIFVKPDDLKRAFSRSAPQDDYGRRLNQAFNRNASSEAEHLINEGSSLLKSGEAVPFDEWAKESANPVAAEAINGAVSCGDWVIVHPNETYGCLVGKVTAIDKFGTPEHGTDNPGDDVHVNFIALEYSEIAKAELLEAFDGIYPDAAHFDELPLDDVIMSPEMLISLTGLEFEAIDKLSASYKAAREFGNKVLSEHFNNLEQQLIKRVEQNYADYQAYLMDECSHGEVIDNAAKIHAMSDAYSYLTAYHTYSDDELELLSKFENPLAVVGDAWHKRNIDLEDMYGTMEHIYECRESHLSVYPLISDADKDASKEVEPAAEPEKPAAKPKPAPAQTKPNKKPSITEGLQDAIAEAREHNAAQVPATPNKSKQREVD